MRYLPVRVPDRIPWFQIFLVRKSLGKRVDGSANRRIRVTVHRCWFVVHRCKESFYHTSANTPLGVAP
jgi:hypothetical protein